MYQTALRDGVQRQAGRVAGGGPGRWRSPGLLPRARCAAATGDGQGHSNTTTAMTDQGPRERGPWIPSTNQGSRNPLMVDQPRVKPLWRGYYDKSPNQNYRSPNRIGAPRYRR